ncbi:MAG: NUDIX hydrolase [Porticoccus sp.]|nr:NUDIX hydrolase [Porticoccus sp.]
MPDKIHLTVATVVERENHFLLVREICEGREVFNQPAGHVEPGESLVEAAIRETYEETAWRIKPTGVISFGSYTSASNGVTYYRLALTAEAIEFDDSATIDSDIEEAVWLDYADILQKRSQLRSPMVLQAIDDYRAKIIYPLDLLKTHR